MFRHFIWIFDCFQSAVHYNLLTRIVTAISEHWFCIRTIEMLIIYHVIYSFLSFIFIRMRTRKTKINEKIFPYLSADKIWKLVLKLLMSKQDLAIAAIKPNWTFFSVEVFERVIRSVIHLLTWNRCIQNHFQS